MNANTLTMNLTKTEAEMLWYRLNMSDSVFMNIYNNKNGYEYGDKYANIQSKNEHTMLMLFSKLDEAIALKWPEFVEETRYVIESDYRVMFDVETKILYINKAAVPYSEFKEIITACNIQLPNILIAVFKTKLGTIVTVNHESGEVSFESDNNHELSDMILSKKELLRIASVIHQQIDERLACYDASVHEYQQFSKSLQEELNERIRKLKNGDDVNLANWVKIKLVDYLDSIRLRAESMEKRINKEL